MFAVKVNQENTSLTVIIDKNIIQFTFKEQTDFSVIKIILNCFPEEFTNSLKSPILVVDGYIEKSIDMENYNNLFNENSLGYSFNLKHFGVEFNTKSYSYRITSTIRKKDIKMVIRIPLKKDNFNLEEDIHLAKTGLYDEVLPEFNKFIRSERK